ncbi:MAG: ABC transporter substrate-binding protein, partial [Lachnospiraceae bacterium]|nr:ABC transporter substrate-binding protein [Lachnospiraceae bacterium]
MKNGKKLLALLAAASLTVLTACGTVGGQAAAEAPAAEEPKTEEAAPAQEQTEETADSAEAAEGESYLVGICQLVQHPALDAATQGFKDALTEALGDAVSFDEQNAAGDAAT